MHCTRYVVTIINHKVLNGRCVQVQTRWWWNSSSVLLPHEKGKRVPSVHCFSLWWRCRTKKTVTTSWSHNNVRVNEFVYLLFHRRKFSTAKRVQPPRTATTWGWQTLNGWTKRVAWFYGQRDSRVESNEYKLKENNIVTSDSNRISHEFNGKLNWKRVSISRIRPDIFNLNIHNLSICFRILRFRNVGGHCRGMRGLQMQFERTFVFRVGSMH